MAQLFFLVGYCQFVHLNISGRIVNHLSLPSVYRAWKVEISAKADFLCEFGAPEQGGHISAHFLAIRPVHKNR